MTAEEYIEAYTRRSSNLADYDGLPIYEPWMTVDGCREAVRLARMEVIEEIEKLIIMGEPWWMIGENIQIKLKQLKQNNA